MVNIPMKSTAPLTRQTVTSINQRKVQGARTKQDVLSLNMASNSQSPSPSVSPTVSAAPNMGSRQPVAATVTQQVPVSKPIPNLQHTVQKGQKVPLGSGIPLTKIKACLGWNTLNANCDVDVSAFLLNASGKVLGDTWFVFYGQEQSPDNSTIFSVDQGADREIITVDFSKLNPNVSKIVFVLTINEALEKSLNFSMLKDAYVRILDASTGTELVSFLMTDYYANVTSMMIGEIYNHNGAWKFNAIGNGVARDLAGLCELYGVQVI